MCCTVSSVQAMGREKGYFCNFSQILGKKCLSLTAPMALNHRTSLPPGYPAHP